MATYLPEGHSMSLLSHPEEELVLCSPMSGRITFNKTPLAGAKIERVIKWKDGVGQTDTTITDQHGNFMLPVIKEKAKLPKLSQFVVLQEMRVFRNGESHVFWTMSQMGKEARRLYGELGGKPVNFRCELTRDSTTLRLEDAFLITQCEWDSIEKIKGE